MQTTTGIICDHCGSNPGTNRLGVVWRGFFDMETKEHCCNKCRTLHYQKKAKTEHKGLYSEFPVTLAPANQLN